MTAGMGGSSRQSAPPSGTAVLVAGVVVLALAIVAYIYCEANGIESAPLITLVGLPLGALWVMPTVQRTERAATAAQQQTNGALDARIVAGVHAVMDARDKHRAKLLAESAAAQQLLPVQLAPAVTFDTPTGP